LNSELLERLRHVVSGGGDRTERAARAAELIRNEIGYRWVGIYDVLPGEIAVIAWSGPAAPTHPRFPRSRGLNGAAVAAGEPVVVQDVSTDPRYLTTLGTTRSEAVFPVTGAAGEVMGTLDIESEHANAFTTADRAGLEECAAALAPLWT
jgi:L-methionine (R)-S-oxide reductase